MRNSKLGQTKKVIYNVLADGQPHRVSDFFEAAYPILRTLLVLPAGGVPVGAAAPPVPHGLPAP